MSIHKPNAPHLGENDILQAVADDAGLPARQQQHLAECSRCRDKKLRLENELAHLGRLAERYAPEPLQRITLPDDRIRWPFSIRGIVFSAATVAAVIIVVWAAFWVRNQQQGGIGNVAQNMVEAERLMTEINGLVENALPQVYLDIVGETTYKMDEDFIDFLIPTEENENRLSASARKGSMLC